MTTHAPSWIVRSETRYCRPCGRQVLSKPRARFAALGVGGTVALVLALIGFSALIGPFIMFTVPFILAAGFAIGPLVSLATEPPACPHCHRELVYASRDELVRRIERARPRASIAVGDMKAA